MDLEKLQQALRRNRFEVSLFPTGEAAARYLDGEIDGKTVGFGDSETILDMGIYHLLSAHNMVYAPQHSPEGRTFYETGVDALTTQVFLTSANAISETGQLVNLDGTGNRVAGSLFGHQRVYFVVSTKKVTPDLESAIHRVRNVAAPLNAKRHGVLTPCAVKGDKCYDCASPDRICNALVVHYKAMSSTRMEVVLVEEPLGL